MNINYLTINNEKIAFFTFFDHNNRKSIVTEWHQKVCNILNIPINYISVDYKQYNHGDLIRYFILNVDVDYFCFLDNDCCPLTKELPYIIYDKLKDKNTIFGGAQNTNHIHKENQHPFVAPSSFCISKELFQKIGAPDLSDRNIRSDNTEEATFKCQELGFNVCLVYPVSFYKLTPEEMTQTNNPEYWNLNNGKHFHFKYGLGTNYGNLFFHAMMQNLDRSSELFIETCKTVIEKNQKEKRSEAIIASKNYSDYLSLTLKENIKIFDNIIIVTSEDDTKTIDVCKEYKNVKCVIYDGWNKKNAKFNKGGALNFGCQFLEGKEWISFLDSDILIKEDFKTRLIDKNKFYGSYRRFIPSINDYNRLLNKFYENNDILENYEKIEGAGCGFFQCIHYSHLENFKKRFGYIYPDSYSAEQVDIDFLRQFCQFDGQNYENLVRLNIEVWHLGQHGINNLGRNNKDLFFNENS